MKSIKLSLLAVALLVLLSACKANVSRNDDGTLTVETAISQAQLQEVISSSIADPLIKELNVSLQSGYVSVTGTRQRLNDASKTDSMSFRLDLGVSNGDLTAAISNAEIDGIAIESNRVDNWNQTIANRLAIISGRTSRNATPAIGIRHAGAGHNDLGHAKVNIRNAYFLSTQITRIFQESV